MSDGVGYGLVLIADVAVAWFQALCFAALWRWFIVPVFAAPALTTPQALGVVLVLSFIQHRYSDREMTVELAWKRTFDAFFTALLFVAIGWVLFRVVQP